MTKQRGKLRPRFFYGELKRFKKAELLILSGFIPMRMCVWDELPAWEVLCAHVGHGKRMFVLALRLPHGALVGFVFFML